MQIAITGGNGRVGQGTIALAQSEGHDIVNIDLTQPDGRSDASGMRRVALNVTDYEALVDVLQGCDALIHLAAIPSPGRQPDHIIHNNNVVGSYNAMRAAVEVGIKRVCQASSINAIGGVYSRWPHYDYFPLDESHATYNEEPYSLSKWICELQADSLCRRYEELTVASLRLHGVVPSREVAAKWHRNERMVARHLWGYTRLDATARACLLALSAPFSGHEVFYIVAPDTMMQETSQSLHDTHFPEVPLRKAMPDQHGFFDCSKAERLLGWQHDE